MRQWVYGDHTTGTPSTGTPGRRRKPPQPAAWRHALRASTSPVRCASNRQPRPTACPTPPAKMGDLAGTIRKAMTRQAITEHSSGGRTTASYPPTAPAGNGPAAIIATLNLLGHAM
jgi:hypothetical protein